MRKLLFLLLFVIYVSTVNAQVSSSSSNSKGKQITSTYTQTEKGTVELKIVSHSTSIELNAAKTTLVNGRAYIAAQLAEVDAQILAITAAIAEADK